MQFKELLQSKMCNQVKKWLHEVFKPLSWNVDNQVVLSAEVRKQNRVTQDALGKILYWVMCVLAGGDRSPGDTGRQDFLEPGGIAGGGNLECQSLKTLCSRDQLVGV